MQVDLIQPRLAVGSCPREPADVRILQEQYAVTAVLSLQSDEDLLHWNIDWPALSASYQEAGIQVRRVPVRDFDPDDLRRQLPAGVRALDDLMKAGHTVFVHCNAGINRSPTTVIAYLHWIEDLGLLEAVRHVQAAHACDPYLEAIQLAAYDVLEGNPKSEARNSKQT